MRSLLVIMLLWSSAAIAAPGMWGPAGSSLSLARGTFTTELRALALDDGRVLFAGGLAQTGTTNALSATVDIFNAGAFAPGAAMQTARSMCGMVALVDGGALVAGGGLNNQPAMANAERWSASGSWTSNLTMKAARFGASATRLQDGTVLIVGGTDSGATVPSAEIFDPGNNTFAFTTGAPTNGGLGHVAALLADGRVVLIGGGTFSTSNVSELYSPSTGMFSLGPMLHSHRGAHAGARLFDGRILYAGGCTNATCSTASLNTAEIYTPAAGGVGSIASTGNLNIASGAQSVVTLPSGKVLLAGGISSAAATSRAEIYDPAKQIWTLTSNAMTDARNDAAMALLPDGRVLIAGGRQGTTMTAVSLSSAEIYEPADIPTRCTVCQLDGTCVKLNDGLGCDDGDPLTSGDACSAGACVGAGFVDLALVVPDAELPTRDLAQAGQDALLAPPGADAGNAAHAPPKGCSCDVGGPLPSQPWAVALVALLLYRRSRNAAVRLRVPSSAGSTTGAGSPCRLP